LFDPSSEENASVKTYNAKPGEVERRWYVVDANGQILGRLASFIATRLRGKHKAAFTPYVDTGDFIIVVNADKVKLTGKKLTDKLYQHHTGYMGGLKTISARDLLAKKPQRVVELAVKRMLPNSSLGRSQFMKLKVYAGDKHPHEAQQPTPLQIS
jgi:large subunit ribosomal protein L13